VLTTGRFRGGTAGISPEQIEGTLGASSFRVPQLHCERPLTQRITGKSPVAEAVLPIAAVVAAEGAPISSAEKSAPLRGRFKTG
jgi:hypothetical protein